MNDVLYRQWLELVRAWGVDMAVADQSFEDVREHYCAPGRYYHTLDHIQDMLRTVEGLRRQAQDVNALKLAVWLHDVVYDSKASDNEERSAEYATHMCKGLSIPCGDRVASLILKTKTHDAGPDVDAQVLIDADLAILGAAKTIYENYAEKIRLEYGWVPEPQYRDGRRRILESFLGRPRIYFLLSHLEEPARRNLAAEIVRLA